MRQQEVFNKIGGIIKELNEQYSYLQSAGQLFNDLELELMAANAHFLSDHIEILRKLNKNNEQAKPAEASPQPFLESGTALPQPLFGKEGLLKSLSPGEELEGADYAVEPVYPKHGEVSITYEFELPEVIRHELTMDDIGDDWDEEDDAEEPALLPKVVEDKAFEPEVVKSQPMPLPLSAPEPELTAYQPTPELDFAAPPPAPRSEPQPIVLQPLPGPEPQSAAPAQIKAEEKQVLTLNERMSAQLAANRKSDPAGPQPISDLKGAINLNDKLLYIKDLFHGYSLAYSEALDILNRLDNLEEAQQYLKSTYAIKNNWADKEATVQKFYALLQRRYL